MSNRNVMSWIKDGLDWRIRNYRWRIFYKRLAEQEPINRAFDERFGTDTAAEIPLKDTGVPESEAARGNTFYRPFWEGNFRSALERLPVDFSKFTFIDIGSGKGKIMMLASDYPFRHIVGVEYSPDLHETAVANLGIYRSPTQRCASFEARLGDALDYAMPEGAVVCLIFNSLDQATTRLVLANIERDVGGRDQPVFLIYANLRTVAEIGSAFEGGAVFQRLYGSRREIILGNAAARVAFRAGGVG